MQRFRASHHVDAHDATVVLTTLRAFHAAPVALETEVNRANNSWWSNYGQLRCSTDRNIVHRYAAIRLATTVLMTARLIDYGDRWSPTPSPIR